MENQNQSKLEKIIYYAIRLLSEIDDISTRNAIGKVIREKLIEKEQEKIKQQEQEKKMEF